MPLTAAQIVHYYYSGGGGSAPTQQAYNFELISFTSTTQTWQFKRGNGDGVLVGIREGGVVELPDDGVSYAFDLNYGDGDLIGTSSYAVLVVLGTDPDATVQFTVTGLTPGQITQVRAFEFNGVYNVEEAGSNPEEGISPEAQAVLDLHTGLTSEQEAAIVAFVNSQVASDNWAKLDVFQVLDLGLGTANRLKDWKANANPTNPNGHSFATGGLDIPGGTAVGGFHTNYNPASNGPNWVVGNAFEAVYVYTNDSNTDNRRLIGAGTTTYWSQRTVANRLDFNVNTAVVQKTSYPNGWTKGLWSIKLEDAGGGTVKGRAFKDATDLGLGTNAVTPVERNGAVIVGGTTGSVLLHDGVLSLYIAGGGDIDVADLSENIDILLAALGL